MSTSYMSQDSLIQDRQLKVIDLSIPLLITANATPASVGLSNDEPARLFLKTEGVDQITLANGAVSSQAELDAITFQSLSGGDAAGKFCFLLQLNQPVEKIMCAKLVRRTANGLDSATLTSAPSNGITSEGDKVVMNLDTNVDFSSTSLDACLQISVAVQVS